MAKSQIVGVIYHDDHLIVQRQNGQEEIHTHPSQAADVSGRDYRKEIVDGLRKGDADALKEKTDG